MCLIFTTIIVTITCMLYMQVAMYAYFTRNIPVGHAYSLARGEIIPMAST